MGYLPKYCAAWLEGLASTLPERARVVEIGTASGCSLRSILIGLQRHDDVHVWSIDIKRHDNIHNEMRRFRIPRDRYSVMVGDSHEVAKTWDVLLDMVYVDGDHHLEPATQDILQWSEHLRFGGLMVLDDYEQPMHWVTEAVDGIMFAEDSTWRFVGQVGRMIAFEKGTKYERSPWLTDYMVEYDSYAFNEQTGESDPWNWWALGFPGKSRPELKGSHSYGKSHNGKLP
jgi:predicted O-methyltransferase YrrM